MPAVAGLDLSLTGTAAVELDGSGRPVRALLYSTVWRDTAKAKHGLEILHSRPVKTGDSAGDFFRTAGVAGEVRRFLQRLPAKAVVGIEDHAYGARGRALYQLGHLHGLVRRDAVALGHQFLLLGVGEVKQAATGSGSADKAAMVKAAGDAMDLVGLSRGAQEALADAYAVARLAWWVEYARATPGCTLPPAVARLVWTTKKRDGLIDRPKIGGPWPR